MTKFKVYVTRRVPKPGLDLLLPECDIDFWDSDEAIPQDQLLKNVQGVGALFCMLTDKIDEEVLENAGNISFVTKAKLFLILIFNNWLRGKKGVECVGSLTQNLFYTNHSI